MCFMVVLQAGLVFCSHSSGSHSWCKGFHPGPADHLGQRKGAVSAFSKPLSNSSIDPSVYLLSVKQWGQATRKVCFPSCPVLSVSLRNTLLGRITFGCLTHEGCSCVPTSPPQGTPKQRRAVIRHPLVSTFCSLFSPLLGCCPGTPIRLYCPHSTVQASLPWGDSGLYIPSASTRYRCHCVSTYL